MSGPRRRRSPRSALYKTAAVLVPVVFFLPFLGRARMESLFGEDAAASALSWSGPVGAACLVACTLAADAAFALGVVLWRMRTTRPRWVLVLCCTSLAVVAGAAVAARRAPGTVPELLLACLTDERTIFADGYTHAGFAQVAVGMSEDEVKELLGETIWSSATGSGYLLFYSRPGDGGAHWMRIVELDHRLGSVIRIIERLETD